MRYGLIGKSLIHSYSKEIHEALGRYDYGLYSLSADEMSDFIRSGDFGGLNVTIPYKKDVMALCGETSDLARDIGAVNTLYWKEQCGCAGSAGRGADAQGVSFNKAPTACVQTPATGRDMNEANVSSAANAPSSQGGRILVGHNTDYEGFLYAAKRAGISFAGKTVLILGTGGTSLTARKAVSDSGAAKVYVASRRPAAAAEKNNPEVRPLPESSPAADSAGESGAANTVFASAPTAANAGDAVNQSDHASVLSNCTPCRIDQAIPCASDMSGSASCSPPCPICQLTYAELHGIAGSVQVIVNTTPVGTYPNNLQSVIDISDFPNCESVIDVIYNPFKTKLLLEAEKTGIRFSNGLPMLVAQATAAAGYFLGTPGAFEPENERIIADMERRMNNIVLIGMPGSGKSTIGRLLSEQTGKRFVDMDQEIEARAGISIPEIFERFGEKHFRDLESETAFDLGKEHGLVIAAGGGAVLRPENVDALRQNGLVIHVTRPASDLSTDGRPLSKDIDTLRAMEKERMPIYEAAADLTFDNSESCSYEELAGRLTARLKNFISTTR